MGQVAAKLFSLIMLMQTQRTWKVSELAEKLNVSPRTIHRYLAQLDEMGIPICSERGPHGGFSLMRGYRLPPLLFTAEEATVLYLGAQVVRQALGETLGAAAVGATAKLDNVLPDALREQVDRAQAHLIIGGLTAFDYRPWNAVIHLLRSSIEAGHRVTLRYQAQSGQETERQVSPYALVLQWGLWYMVGYCHLRDSLRTFRVDRILDVQARCESFERPSDFDVRTYMDKAMRFEARYQVRVRVCGPAWHCLRGRYGEWMHCIPAGDDCAVVSFCAADLHWAVGWVLSLGGAARVLEPDELRDAVVAQARQTLAMNDSALSQG